MSKKQIKKLREEFEEKNGFEYEHRELSVYKYKWRRFKKGLDR